MCNHRFVAFALGAALLAAACGSTPATVTPTSTPVPPTPTPNPHLSDPASVDVVYNALVAAGLQISANSADDTTGAMVKRLPDLRRVATCPDPVHEREDTGVRVRIQPEGRPFLAIRRMPWLA